MSDSSQDQPNGDAFLYYNGVFRVIDGKVTMGIDPGVNYDLPSKESSGQLEVRPRPEDSSPVLYGSVIGYRAWNIQDWMLSATGTRQTWEPGIQEAKCNNMNVHLPPDLHCGCGIHGLARFDSGEAYWWKQPSTVLGAIEAWGEESREIHVPRAGLTAQELGIAGSYCAETGFVLQPPGFRARFARAVLLAISNDYPRAKNGAIKALAAEHGADVCKLEHLEAAAKEHGQLVPDELLQWAAEDQFKFDGSWLHGGPFLLRSRQAGYSVAMRKLMEQQGKAIVGVSLRDAAEHLTAAIVALNASPALKPRCNIKQHRKLVGPPTIGKWKANDVISDRRGDLYVCEKKGSPGTWRKIDS